MPKQIKMAMHAKHVHPCVLILLCILLIMFVHFTFYPFSESISSSTIYSNLVSNSFNQSNEGTETKDRIAICLAGGLRRFELTAPTLQANLFSDFENADVFIVAPYDLDAFKLWVLAGSNVVAVHLVDQIPVPEDDILLSVINPYASNSGRQGLMYYCFLAEKCARLIEAYEYKHGFKYDWVLRTRPDGLWSAPPSLAHNLTDDKLYFPKGTNFDGINDRFILGKRDYVLDALNWVSSLPQHLKANQLHILSEHKFLFLLESLNLQQYITPTDLYFCVLTVKAFPWFPDFRTNNPYGSMSLSPIDAPGDGGGRYCRPCEPIPEMPTPEAVYDIFHSTSICDSRVTAFVSNWTDIYDKFLGEAVASKRKWFEENDNFWSCLRLLETFIMRVNMWDSIHNAFEICHKHYNATL